MSRLNLTTFVFGVGFVLGGVAMNGLDAQTASKKAYAITEFNADLADTAGLTAARERIAAAGGKSLYTAAGRVIAVHGDAPKHIGLTEFNSAEDALKWMRAEKPPKEVARGYVVEAEK